MLCLEENPGPGRDATTLGDPLKSRICCAKKWQNCACGAKTRGSFSGSGLGGGAGPGVPSGSVAQRTRVLTLRSLIANSGKTSMFNTRRQIAWKMRSMQRFSYHSRILLFYPSEQVKTSLHKLKQDENVLKRSLPKESGGSTLVQLPQMPTTATGISAQV